MLKVESLEHIYMNDRIEPNVIVLRPEGQGGINRLFSSLFETSPTGRLRIRIVDSRAEGRLDFLRTPIRLFWFGRKVLNERVSLVHINLASRGSTYRKYLFSLVCRILRTPYVLHLHGGEYVRFHRDSNWLGEKVILSLFRRAQHVIVLGSYWKGFVVNTIGVADNCITVLPNAVSKVLCSRARQSDVVKILFLGRLGVNKGVPELIDALASDELKGFSWKAVIAGDGDVQRYSELVKSKGIADRVSVPGWVGAREVEDLLSSSNILVLPSHAENLPLSMLEGMSAGLAVIATPVGAIPEVIRDGDNGLLVPVSDPVALAQALTKVVGSQELRLRLGGQALSDFERHYDISTYRDRLEDIYKKVLHASILCN